jgi:hypothetical protein
MNRIRAAAHDLEQRGFLIAEDSAIISYGAAEVTALKIEFDAREGRALFPPQSLLLWVTSVAINQ